MNTLTKCKSGGQILLIPIDEIVANSTQPRKFFDIEELEGLADSIKQNGIIQPINVRPREDGKYEVIAGERRLRASRIVGLTRVPCILMEANDEKSAVYALLENLQRQDLSFFEEAFGIERLLLVYGMSQDTAAKRLGMAQSTLSNKLRLLKLPEEVRSDILRFGLTERHARALLKLENEAQMKEALKEITEKQLNVSDTDRLVEQMTYRPEKIKKAPIKIFKDVRIFINTLNHAIDTMRKAGIEADSEKNETEEYIEYVVRIPKSKGSEPRRSVVGI